MTSARNRSPRPEGELVDLAIRHYELGERIDALAADRGVEQSTIRRWLSRARKEGIVQTLVVPPLSDEERTTLRQDVRYTFQLEDVVLVPGREDFLDISDETAPKEAMTLSIAQAAARYLEDHLINQDNLIVPWGRMSNYIARQIKARRPLPGLTVGPMVGVLGVEYDPFEANILASTVASKFGGHSLLLPAPAVVDREVAAVVEDMPLVRRVMEFYREATVAIVPIASPDPERSTVVRAGLLDPSQVRDLVARGAVGEIASHWWFDASGQVVEQTAAHAIGLGLEGLSEMVERRAKVVAVVGASRERVSPLRVALNHRLINVLITDHVTAQLLVSRER
jgi:DNA-binding transcriptional regulator LsrR (DeoR family)